MEGSGTVNPFPPASEADWQRLVERVLDGRPFESLVSTTFEGMKIGLLCPRLAPEAVCT